MRNLLVLGYPYRIKPDFVGATKLAMCTETLTLGEHLKAIFLQCGTIYLPQLLISTDTTCCISWILFYKLDIIFTICHVMFLPLEVTYCCNVMPFFIPGKMNICDIFFFFFYVSNTHLVSSYNGLIEVILTST